MSAALVVRVCGWCGNNSAPLTGWNGWPLCVGCPKYKHGRGWYRPIRTRSPFEKRIRIYYRSRLVYSTRFPIQPSSRILRQFALKNAVQP